MVMPGPPSPLRSLTSSLTSMRRALPGGVGPGVVLCRLVPQVPGGPATVVVLLDGSGKMALYQADGTVKPAVLQAVNAGATVLAADLLFEGEFLADGAVDKIFLWDPMVAGQAQDKLAMMLIQGKKIAPGVDLGLPGYLNLRSIPGTPHGFAGSGWIAIDKSNVGQYPF